MIASVLTRRAVLPTRLGELTVVLEGDAVAGLYFPGHWRDPQRAEVGEEVAHDPLAAMVHQQLGEYLDGARRSFELPLALRGSDFHRRVWERLLAIPYGEKVTYGALATELGAAAQAIGGAVGQNPVSIIVPCHRVVGADGSLTGYAGGVERKRALLELEEPAADRVDRLF